MATNKTFIRFDAYLRQETGEQLRRIAFEEHRPMTEIVRELVEEGLKRRKSEKR